MDTSQIAALHNALPGCVDVVQENGDCKVNGNAEWRTPVYHVEVLQNSFSSVRSSFIKDRVRELLISKKIVFGDFKISKFEDDFLSENVEHICLCDNIVPAVVRKAIDLTSSNLKIHVYQTHEDGAGTEELDEENMSAATHWLLPSSEFEGLWESLVYDEPIKNNLLNYASTTLLFSDMKIDDTIISWNRVVLLHGPPGTGKTSLCKALAQKLSIHLSDRYTHGQLVEINSHSLFSKWFSESGKLVMKMFQKIQELINDPDSLVCVLIDEVESLAAARKNAASGIEPSDAIRVVNALLTQLDQIKRYPNVIILTTSNITGAIDLAFVDRADIKQYIGPPSTTAIYTIFSSCLKELMKKGICSGQEIVSIKDLALIRFIENKATSTSLKLYNISEKSVGLSGRALRKLPFIAHALYLQGFPVTPEDYLDALSQAVTRQFMEQDDLTKS